MSLQISMRAIIYINIFFFMIPILTFAEGWKVDLSRRKIESREPASLTDVAEPSQSKGFMSRLLTGTGHAQEAVILLTESGFIPQNVRVKRDQTYRIHVVNVNEKEKNISFVMDAFSEHHAAFYGKIRSFEIRPQKEGVYKFFSPETAAQGRLVVVPKDSDPSQDGDSPWMNRPLVPTPVDAREPASE